MVKKKIDLRKLTNQMIKVRNDVLKKDKASKKHLAEIHPNYHHSARNFIRYLALRTHNLRKVQDKLSCLGLSSISNSERYTLSNLENIIFFLHLMQGDKFKPLHRPGSHPINAFSSRRLLTKNTVRLLGESSRKENSRIMVTLPAEAAEDPSMIENLMRSGMDIARINCGHDNPEIWEKMISHIHNGIEKTRRNCLIYMDISGPKIRTGDVEIKPRRRKKNKKPKDFISLYEGDLLHLHKESVLGRDAVVDKDERVIEPAKISITFPEALIHVLEGNRVMFDDGVIAGRVKHIYKDYVEIEIEKTPPKKGKLRAEKGINLPDTELNLPSLTSDDLSHLPFMAQYADVIGYSFVKKPDDVKKLQAKLKELGREDMGLVLKIESNEAFNNLPALILTAMKSPSVGVMIARGDLAVELGIERISEVQEEILWLCEAAHIPIIWATQVLENLVKNGTATRAEVTDAAMSVRAECVMLNKGSYILQALQILANILMRMEAHQEKKKERLRALSVAKTFFEQEDLK